jgi:hypothetical protein
MEVPPLKISNPALLIALTDVKIPLQSASG